VLRHQPATSEDAQLLPQAADDAWRVTEPEHKKMLDADAPKLRVLVVGSGYVAQHLIAHLKDDFDVAYSHRRQAPPFAVPGVQAVYLDLADDDAVATALHETLPDVVVNCAAVSSPKQCDGCELPARVPGGAARVCPRYPTDSLLDGFGVAR